MIFESIKVGDIREFTHPLTTEDIRKFADLSGDYNPLHLEPEFAQKTDFRKPVAHGMLSASFISTMIGMHLPGEGALWLSQSLKFLRQAYVGDILRIVAKVKQKSESTRVLVLETIVYNQRNEELISGEAQVRVLDLGKENVLMEKKTKVVLVTGASRGIGAAVARQLAQDGHAVAVNYSKSKDEALKVVKDIEKEGGKAIAIAGDITKKEQVQAMCEQVVRHLGAIDGFVSNASGPIVLKSFEEMTWEDFQAHLDVQFKGAIHCIQAVLPQMLKEGGGSVVFIGSIAADGPPPAKQSDYVASKAALAALARSLAVEYGPKNIRVNVVAPGLTQTDLTAELPQKAKELTRMTTPLRRLGLPEDVAGVVSFLMSPGARHVTGETIRVCGGAVMV